MQSTTIGPSQDERLIVATGDDWLGEDSVLIATDTWVDLPKR